MNERIVMHVDLDAFFASVEVVLNPDLKGKPVIVGGDPSKRGVVSTCSYEARRYGVRSAMSLFEAKKRCPHGIFVHGHFDLYRDYSEQVMGILLELTPHVEIVGIDEAYMDVTDCADQNGGAFKLGQLLRRRVFESTKLTISVGIGSNKLIAKIASGHAKPNGLFEVPAGQEVAFLAPLPIESLPGVGVKTQAFLNREGIKTVSQIQEMGLDQAVQLYGAHGYWIYMAAIGKDNRPVETSEQPPKSIGGEETFEKDLSDSTLLQEALVDLLQRVYKRLRSHRMRTRGLSLKLRFADFTTITRSITFVNHTNDYLYLKEEMLLLFSRVYDGKSPLRLVGVTLEKLTDQYWQPTFWH
ncbi:MAG: DNA polymerase IV [Parachlamydia sp.]|nr:DNA polymerase IV [Parachlamydia sp.]